MKYRSKNRLIHFKKSLNINIIAFFDKIKSKLKPIKEWFYLPKWKNRLIFYLLIFFLMNLLFFSIIFPFFGLLNNDIDSALYMLSALVQSEAAIIAIVISLSILAVQLSSQTYSTRVIEIYKNTPDLWILILIYLFAIIYGLGVLKLIETDEYEISNLLYIGFSITFSYFLGIFAFVSLVFYILYVFQLLKPLNIIELLSEKITIQSIIEINNEQDMENSYENDSIQNIIDILRGSLERNDFKTLKDGFLVIDEKINILKNSEINDIDYGKFYGGFKEFQYYILWQFTGVGRMAISRDDEDSTIEVIKYIYKNGEIALLHRYESEAKYAIKSIADFGKRGSEKKLENVVGRSIESLEFLGESAIKSLGESANDQSLFDSLAKMAVEYIGEVAEEGSEQKQRIVMEKSTESLGNIGILAVEKGLEVIAIQTTMDLEVIGKNSIQHHFEVVSDKVVKYLGMIGIEIVGSRSRNSIKIVKSLSNIGILALENSSNTTIRSVESLGDIVKRALKKKELEEVTNKVIECFEETGLRAVDLKLDRVIWKILEKLGEIGIETAELNLENTTERIIELLENIGIATIEQNFQNDLKLRFLINIRNVALINEYLFNWDEIPDNNKTLIKLLTKRFDIEWARNAKIEKIDTGKTIRLSFQNNSLTLNLADYNSKVYLKIDDDRIYEYKAKLENGTLKIYKINQELRKKTRESLINIKEVAKNQKNNDIFVTSSDLLDEITKELND